MKFKHGDVVDVEGYLCEVIKVTESYIEVLYGDEALYYYVEKYDINDARVVLSNNASHKNPTVISCQVEERGNFNSFLFFHFLLLLFFVVCIRIIYIIHTIH